jgi:hypothetical protein
MLWLALLEGEAGSPVTVVSLPGRRAAGGRPQGRPWLRRWWTRCVLTAPVRRPSGCPGAPTTPISGLVITTEDGRPFHPETLSGLFVRQAKRSGLPPIRLHDLRHSVASILLARGVHPKVVSEMLDHATIALTLDTYSHVIPSRSSRKRRVSLPPPSSILPQRHLKRPRRGRSGPSRPVVDRTGWPRHRATMAGMPSSPRTRFRPPKARSVTGWGGYLTLPRHRPKREKRQPTEAREATAEPRHSVLDTDRWGAGPSDQTQAAPAPPSRSGRLTGQSEIPASHSSVRRVTVAVDLP